MAFLDSIEYEIKDQIYAPELQFGDAMKRELGMTDAQVYRLLKAVAKAGFVIAPREPANSMIGAYITAVGPMSKHPATVMRHVSKCRKRWKAMALAGTKVVFAAFLKQRGYWHKPESVRFPEK